MYFALQVKYIHNHIKMSSYYDTSSSDGSLDIYDEILEQEEAGGETEFVHNHRYVGLPYYDQENNVHILASTVKPQTFHTNTHDNLIDYLYQHSIVRVENPEMEIMQLNVANDVFEVIIKTHWIKLIQRKWKKTYVDRMTWYKNQLQFGYLRAREIEGQGAPCPFQLRGMLSHLSVNK
jgi:hypothetical protein